MSHTLHGKWSQPGVPHKGWSFVDLIDLGEPCQTCEMCESMTIRYVHVMEHPNYSGPLEVGCICAGHMEQDLIGARLREKTFKSSLKRRQRLLERDWPVSQRGNSYINTGAFNIVVFPCGSLWSGRVEYRPTGYRMNLPCQYKSEDEAKAMAIDVVEQTEQLLRKG